MESRITQVRAILNHLVDQNGRLHPDTPGWGVFGIYHATSLSLVQSMARDDRARPSGPIVPAEKIGRVG